MSKASRFFDSEISDQFFTIRFVKKSTGEIRTLNGRKGVTKFLKGSGSNKRPDHLRVVWDRNKGEYRSFDIRTLISVSCKGQVVESNVLEGF